jgi:hypothetical protein
VQTSFKQKGKDIGLVEIEGKGEQQNSEKQITLEPNFDWFLSEDFSKLRRGFIAEDGIDFMSKSHSIKGNRCDPTETGDI